MKLLNLDSLAKPPRIVSLHGKEYAVKELTVDDFVKLTMEAEAQEKVATPLTTAEHVDGAVKGILTYIPELDEATVRALSIEQLGTLGMFVRGELDTQLNEATAVAEASAGEKQT